MKYLILLIALIGNCYAQSPWYYGAGKAVNLENAIQYKNGVMNIAGSLDPSTVAVNAPAGSLYESTNGKVYVKQDAGSSTNWFPIASGPAGSPNTFAGFDSSGTLSTIPGWTFETALINGANISSSADGGSHGNIIKIYGNIGLGDGVSGDAALYTNTYFDNFLQDNYALGSYTSFFSNLNSIGAGSTIGNATIMGGGISVDVTNNARATDFSINGDAANVYGNTFSYNGTSSGDLEGFRANTSGSFVNGRLLALNSQADSSNQLELITPTNSGAIANNFYIINGQNTGTVGGTANFISLNNNSAASVSSGLTAINFQNDAAIDQYFNYFSFRNTGAINGNFNGGEISNSPTGSADNFQGLRVNNQGSISGDIKLIDVGDTSTSAADFLGVNVNASGTYDDVTGLRVSVSAATDSADGRTMSGNFEGGSFNVFSAFTTVSNIPSVVDSGNTLITNFTVNSGAPITGTSVIAQNMSTLMNFNDDYTEDAFFHLGYVNVGYVSQLNVAAGKTVSKTTQALGAYSVPPSSLGGTVTEASVFSSRGAINSGGTVGIDTLYNYRTEDGGCVSFATDCYGVSVEDTLADNFLSKSLQIGGTQAPLDASSALYIGSKKAIRVTPMTTTEKNALTPLESMLVYDDTLGEYNYYDGSVWQSMGGGSGSITDINGETGPSITFATGTTGTDFNLAVTSNTLTFHLPTASATNRGALSSADWTTFNSKQAAGNYITALTGDVTASGPGSVAATIANLAVTNAKIANATIDLTTKVTGLLPLASGGTNKNMTAVNGGVVWTDADSQEVTAAGTSGQILQSNGAASPTWVTPSAYVMPVLSKSATYTVLLADFGTTSHLLVKVNATGGAVTINLPPIATVLGYRVYVKKTDSSANAVTIDPDSTEVIDGATTYVLNDQYQTIESVADATGWNIL